MSVCVLERTPHFGGGACTSEGPAPGYLMNHCSHWTRFYGHPAYRDFDLAAEGLRYVFPDQNEGMIFDDGSSFIGYSAATVVDPASGRTERSDENIARTHEQIARFSSRDAETYLAVLDVYERHWKQAFKRHRFSPPPPGARPTARGAARRPGQPARARAPGHDAAPARVRLLRERRAAHPVHARGHDLDRQLPRRRARPPGPRARAAADAEPRAGGDRGGRQPGDHGRADVGRPQAGRGVLQGVGRRPDRRRGHARHGRRAGRRHPHRRRHGGERPGPAADRAAAAARHAGGRSARPPHPQHPLRPRPALLEQPRHQGAAALRGRRGQPRRRASSRASTGARRTWTT